MKEFTIDRKTWLKGEGAEKSFLLRLNDGKRCCLGFYCSSCEINDNDLMGMCALADIYSHDIQDFEQKLGESFSDFDNIYVNLMMTVNDANIGTIIDVDNMYIPVPNGFKYKFSVVSEEAREKELTRLFAEVGVTVKFEG